MGRWAGRCQAMFRLLRLSTSCQSCRSGDDEPGETVARYEAGLWRQQQGADARLEADHARASVVAE